MLTFEQLHARVEGAASGLAAEGFTTGDVLSIHMANHPDFFTAMLAAIKLGGTVSPSNPVYTARELRHQITDSGATYALTSAELLPVVSEATRDTAVDKVYVLGSNAAWLDHPAQGTATAMVNPKTHLAVLPYSSGTTGLPKGVMLSHYNITSNICQYSDCPELNTWSADCRVLGVLPFFHIYGMVIVGMCPLYRGIPVVTMSKFEPVAFLTALQEHKITRAYVVPPIVLFMTKHPMVNDYNLSKGGVSAGPVV